MLCEKYLVTKLKMKTPFNPKIEYLLNYLRNIYIFLLKICVTEVTDKNICTRLKCGISLHTQLSIKYYTQNWFPKELEKTHSFLHLISVNIFLRCIVILQLYRLSTVHSHYKRIRRSSLRIEYISTDGSAIDL
jgi:hypothetical protein